MQLHPGLAGSITASRCRTLVGGFGSPGRRDLDFGEKFIRCAEALEWPDGVVLEDLSYSAHLVLHRLQELRPAKVVLVGAVSRGQGVPGSIRRYRLDPAPSHPEDVHDHLVDAVAGEVGLDHTLAVVRHWGCLPADTVVVEIEAADASFGVGFSEELAGAIDPLLEMVREELGGQSRCDLQEASLASALGAASAAHPTGACDGRSQTTVAPEGVPGIRQLFEYAEAHSQVRGLEGFGRRLPRTSGLSLAARFVPAGRALRTTGNWYDVIPLDAGVGLVMGDVSAQGMQAASEVAELRAAVRAFALLEGHRPARLITLLDRLVGSSDMREGATLVYLAVDAASGKAVFSNAGHCPPVLVSDGGSAHFLDGAASAPLGRTGGGSRAEAVVGLAPGATLLLFSTGVVEGGGGGQREGLQKLRRAIANGPRDIEKLCDHVLEVCTGEPRDDDASLLAVRLDN